MVSEQDLAHQPDGTATASQETMTPVQSQAAFDIRALSRARMEREASKKRERSISPPPVSRKAPKLEPSTVTLASGARLTSFSTLVQNDQESRKPESANVANQSLKTVVDGSKPKSESALPTPPSTQPDLQYPKGVVKKTWAYGHERTGKDIKLEEVLEPHTLRIAVLSAFQWDAEWVLSKLKVPQNGGRTKCVFVMQAKEDSLKQEMLEQTKDQKSWLRLCFPSMEGQIHCMHSKLMLLFHPTKLRVAIPTANLLNFDWGETGVMENSVWFIDLPRNGGKTKKEDLAPFGQELLFYCQRLGLDQDVLDGLLNFDFAATADIAFVHTVGGVSYGDNAQRTGLPGLAKAVRDHGLENTDPELDFAASSIGSLNDGFLRHVQAAAAGEDMISRADAAVTAAKTNFFQAKPKSSDHSIRDKFRIYFPTHETVTSSKAGAVGTICLSRKWFENMTFPRRCFRDYISTRPGLLSHNKILYVRGLRKEENQDDEKVAWVYVGSANMSESAWGKLVYDKKAKEWKINCRNWECGVLLPVDLEDQKGEGVVGMEVFNELVEPPFMYPGVEYEDGVEPWYFQEKQ